MAADLAHGAFSDPAPHRVVLPNSPLVRVLAQVRFPQLATMRQEAIPRTLDAVINDLSDGFPLMERSQEVQFSFGPAGFSSDQAGQLWELKSLAGDWTVSIGATSVAMHTGSYADLNDFRTRFEVVLESLAKHVRPPRYDRIGVRFTNRVENPELLANLASLIRPEMIGGGAAVAGRSDVVVQHTLHESLYVLGEDILHARWGSLPAGAVVDPSLPGAAVDSWFLDLDSFRQASGAFSPSDISEEIRKLGKTAYRFFRWAVTDQFLAAHGASS
ncbi:TIGR04255 family protein [Klenkia brasiliensis]|uniref:TIGR04255 family protein n=1 Tax=Klenkia brasiliensis TaxID=333142 RepID=A0A1G7PJZ8_9ACTN|nr:TIGR04255 family protein [Klenkia brasiliensis]SDF86538.1 TIGR04255 family protein [Klenkia brasiliensis]